jgi:hypothetical protein
MRQRTGSQRTPLAAAALAALVLASSAAATDSLPAAAPAHDAAPALSADAHRLVQWIARSGDHRNAPFLIVDKRNARVLVFDASAHLVADAPVLLGAARGDDSVPGIGERKISDIKPFERTTPAGRFEAEAGRNLQNEDIVWIDYDAAVSMHRVRATNPRERRLQRLATPTTADNRISYGCINVPAAFFDAHVSPLFRNDRHAIVYVLPETRSLDQTFRGYRPSDTVAQLQR